MMKTLRRALTLSLTTAGFARRQDHASAPERFFDFDQTHILFDDHQRAIGVPIAKREKAWQRLAKDLPASKLASITTVEPMSKLPELAGSILAGKVRGRVVTDVTR